MRLLAASLLIALAPQDKVELKLKYRQGDTISSTSTTNMKITGKMVMQGREQDITVERRTAKKRHTTYETVTDGKPTRGLIETEEDYEETKEPGAQDFRKYEFPTKGSRVTVSMVDGKPNLEGADSLDERLRRQFTLEDPFSKFMPKRPVAVGEGWEYGGKELQVILNNDQIKEGKLNLKLKEVKDIQGKQCAVLNVRQNVKVKTDQGELTQVFTGDVVIWLETGYTLSAKLEGTATFKEFGPFKMTGNGPATLEYSATTGQ